MTEKKAEDADAKEVESEVNKVLVNITGKEEHDDAEEKADDKDEAVPAGTFISEIQYNSSVNMEFKSSFGRRFNSSSQLNQLKNRESLPKPTDLNDFDNNIEDKKIYVEPTGKSSNGHIKLQTQRSTGSTESNSIRYAFSQDELTSETSSPQQESKTHIQNIPYKPLKCQS